MSVPTDVATAEAAAQAFATALPSPVPLEVVDATQAGMPEPDAASVRAGFVGATSADLVAVAGEAVAAALATAVGLSLADAVRPALEAAGRTLGTGVLDEAVEAPVADALAAPDVRTFALVDTLGTAVAWFGLRIRQTVSDVPHQRDAAPAAAPAAGSRADSYGMRLLHDVEMTLTAEIGRTKLPVRQVLDLVPGTILELDRAAGAPADVLVNGRLVARGEVVVVDEDYGIRITEIVTESAS
ncbi:flagellar motor switch protein FliN [Isoptericola sp. b441]|uniref:Flagellar motor switch protein FliN n=1 Tax=Actinotalea lenta TaxID=3064654 RepID=A0ABT9D5M7_9CELL|nr:MULTISPECIES: flagellar motor switch protein FliN [unclassified Isoptericola]MDO8106109.1 flagellar motor switch protein FliN [Isoptericola sp. b441]MDO8122172.1 flagellar motor switch protein FliN [Isoptericola sp. b490]